MNVSENRKLLRAAPGVVHSKAMPMRGRDNA
jgi:hypothetical protein